MKSKNQLTLSSTISKVSNDRKSITLVHNFGGGIPSLFLTCRKVSAPIVKGMIVIISGYIRPGRRGIEAVINDLQIN